MRIILARHGDAQNSTGKFHGLEDEPITSKGREESYKLANELKQYNPKMIYYSPLSRTRDTASIISDELNIPKKANDNLLPLDLGNFVGKPVDKYRNQVKYYLSNPDKKIPGSRESVNDWAGNYLPLFEQYFRHKSPETIIFMTHGKNILLSKGYIDKGNLAPDYDKNILTNNNESTEHGGYAIATPPDDFEIVTPKKVAAGTS